MVETEILQRLLPPPFLSGQPFYFDRVPHSARCARLPQSLSHLPACPSPPLLPSRRLAMAPVEHTGRFRHQRAIHSKTRRTYLNHKKIGHAPPPKKALQGTRFSKLTTNITVTSGRVTTKYIPLAPFVTPARQGAALSFIEPSHILHVRVCVMNVCVCVHTRLALRSLATGCKR